MNRLSFMLIIGFLTCYSVTSGQEKSSGELYTDRVSITETIQDNCTRGAAKPIIKKSVFPQTTFVLQPDHITGIEKVIFDNGDKLTIKNWGCEYYVLTFRFETSRLQQDTANLYFWFKGAGILMNWILDGVESPVDIQKGLNKLKAYMDNKESLKLREEIDFGEGDIRSFVSVDRVEKLTDQKYAIEISFATGPL